MVAAEKADDLGIEPGIFFDEIYYTDVLTGAVRDLGKHFAEGPGAEGVNACD